jgi:hypothetical protein
MDQISIKCIKDIKQNVTLHPTVHYVFLMVGNVIDKAINEMKHKILVLSDQLYVVKKTLEMRSSLTLT